MASVELIVGWEGGVTEPPYRLLTDADQATLSTASACDGVNLTATSGEDCDQGGDPGCGCRSKPVDEPREPPNWPVFLLFVIVIMTIGGNVLVCLAVAYKRKLQNMFNYFLVSLALSDMLSAILVMPLSIIKTAVGKSLQVDLSCFKQLQPLWLRCNNAQYRC